MADTKIKSSTAAGNLYLYDRIINLKLFHKTDEDKNISIECNAYGMKPDITLEIIEIPNNSCFQAVVQVRNLIIDDVRSYTSMSIEAGYYGLNMTKVAEVDTTYGKTKGNGSTLTFNIDIFSAYNETPNPDGITTFNGLIVGSITGFLEDKPVSIDITDDISYKELIEEVVSKASDYKMEPVIYMSDEQLEDIKYEVVKDKNKRAKSPPIYLDSGYAAIMWLQSKLFNMGKKVLGYPIFLIIWDRQVHIVPLNEDTKLKDDEYAQFAIVNLDAVSKASFAGPALSVVAPWVPQVIPGSLIRMPPAYYTGKTLPNTMEEDTYSNVNNLYYVIRNEVKFSTVGSTNQMQLLAIPVQYVVDGDDMLSYKTPSVSADKMNSLKNAYFKKHEDDNDVINIVIPEGKGKEGKQLPSEMRSFWRYANDDLQGFDGSDVFIGDTSKYVTALADCWINAAIKMYGSSRVAFKKDDLILSYGREKYRKICKDPRSGISFSEDAVRVPMHDFWVMAVLGTYWQYKSANNKGPYGTNYLPNKDGKYEDTLVISMTNPDVIKDPTLTWFPSFTASDIEGGRLDSFASAFISFGNYYISTYKGDKANKDKYDFGIKTFRVGVCLGGYDG